MARLIAQFAEERNRDRLKAGAAVAAFHALLGYALISGLGVEAVATLSENLKVFAVPPEPPPPPLRSVPAKARTEAPEGAASPTSLRANPSPIVVPPPEIQIEVPPTIVTTDKPTPVTSGNDPRAGVSTIDGPGTGTGGFGIGTGSGGQGNGTGGGGSRAVRVSGGISGATDYPKAARRARIEGSVGVRFIVQPDGSVRGCTVTRSSGNAELDATTCTLIERRFRYEPARDAAGRPMTETVRRTFDWLLPLKS